MTPHLYRTCCLLAWLLLTHSAFAQPPQRLDSLAVYLKTHSPTDTHYVRALFRYGTRLVFEKAEYDRAMDYAREAEALARKMNWGMGLYQSHRLMATVHFHKSDLPEALAEFKRALHLVETVPLSKQDAYAQLGNICMVQEKMGLGKAAMETALKAIRLQEQYQLKPRYANTYATVADVLKSMGKPEQALPYQLEARAIEDEGGDQRGIAVTENQLGNLYDDLKQPTEALRHYRTALKLSEAAGYELLQADALINIANMMDQLKRPQEGLPYARKAFRIGELQKNDITLSTASCTLGLLYQSLEDYPKAELYLRKALALAQKLEDTKKIKLYTQGLADLKAKQQSYQEAYAFQLRKNQLIDSAATVRTNADIQQLVTRYETEKKEQQIRLLRQEAQLREQALTQSRWQRNALLIGGLLLLLLGGAVAAYLLNRARLRRLEEAQRLRQQIAQDLHDEVGSTLSSISLLSGMTSSLLEQNRPETAQKMVQKIYTDARQILEAIDEIIWTINPGNDSLQRIVFRLQEYARPLMESRNIAFTFGFDPSLENLPVSMEVRRNLYLIAKEAINNLIKYSEATQAVVRFDHRGEQLTVIIEDNGRGFDPSEPTTRNGQQSMRKRAEALEGSLTVESAPNQGTKLEVMLPLI